MRLNFIGICKDSIGLGFVGICKGSRGLWVCYGKKKSGVYRDL